MCIMSIREGQHTSTLMQAMAHNTSTIIADCAMLRVVLTARHDTGALALLDGAERALKLAYSRFLAEYGEEVAHDIRAGRNADDEPIGTESVPAHVHKPADDKLVDDAILTDTVLSALDGTAVGPIIRNRMRADAHRAERFETR
jgi:hypothetical protein